MAEKTIKVNKYLSKTYQKYEIESGNALRDYLYNFDMFNIGFGKEVRLTFRVNSTGCYTTPDGRRSDVRRIVLGGKLIQQIANLPEVLTLEDIKKSFTETILGFKGVNYHELGHNLVTDMTSKDIIEYPNVGMRDYLHNFFNIFEDIVVENHMSSKFKDARKCFSLITRRLFLIHADEYKYEANINNFANYLLLLLRLGYPAIPEKNEVYESRKSDIDDWLRKILFEPKGKERLLKTIAFCEWLKESVPELEWDRPPELKEKTSGTMPSSSDSPEDADTGESGEDGLPKPMGAPEKDSKSSKLKGEKSEGESPEPGETPKEGEGDKPTSTEKEEEEGETPTMGDDTSDDGSEDYAPDEDLLEEFEDGADDEFEFVNAHEWVNAKEDYFVKDDSLYEVIDAALTSYREPIDEIAKTFALIKSRTRPQTQRNFKRGKLDIRAVARDEAQNGCSTRLFQREVPRGKQKDLAVWLLGDNSGSMNGMKSHIAAGAMLALAQACEWAGIPCCASCFSKTEDCISGTSYTIIEKDFNDSFDDCKPWFAINDSSLIWRLGLGNPDIPNFRGNSEEVNLLQIKKRFSKMKNEYKLLIVLCDGETTGSMPKLASVVKEIEAAGIRVIGIGLCCSSMGRFYSENKIFSSIEDLKENLAQYLIDLLEEYR